MYFTKQKNSGQISPDNVVLSYFFCFPLLPVLWYEKFVQMIKLLKTCCCISLFCCIFFSLNFDVNKNQADNIRILHSVVWLSVCGCSWKCECSWKQVADIFTDNKHGCKTTDRDPCRSTGRAALRPTCYRCTKRRRGRREWRSGFSFTWEKLTFVYHKPCVLSPSQTSDEDHSPGCLARVFISNTATLDVQKTKTICNTVV